MRLKPFTVLSTYSNVTRTHQTNENLRKCLNEFEKIVKELQYEVFYVERRLIPFDHHVPNSQQKKSLTLLRNFALNYILKTYAKSSNSFLVLTNFSFLLQDKSLDHLSFREWGSSFFFQCVEREGKILDRAILYKNFKKEIQEHKKFISFCTREKLFEDLKEKVNYYETNSSSEVVKFRNVYDFTVSSIAFIFRLAEIDLLKSDYIWLRENFEKYLEGKSYAQRLLEDVDNFLKTMKKEGQRIFI